MRLVSMMPILSTITCPTGICTSLHESAFMLRTPKDDTVLKVRHGLSGTGYMKAASALGVEATNCRPLFSARHTFLSEKNIKGLVIGR
jgi:hypothetical protein